VLENDKDDPEHQSQTTALTILVRCELAGLIDNLYEFVSKSARPEKSSSKTSWRRPEVGARTSAPRMQDWIGMSARRLRAMDLFGAVAHDVEADLRVGVRGVK
jgi:hypothetical protein